MAQGARRPARHARQASRFATLVGRGEKPDQQHGPVRKAPDEATVSYIKRTLCKQLNATGSSADAADDIDSKPLEELLPPLTSSNEIDVQLYALIAVVLNLFVQSWYNKITPDQDFVANVVQIIAHCTRGLEQRLRNVDMEHLVFEELPGLLAEHIDAVRIASRGVQHSNPGRTNRILYHNLRPHPALSPVPNSPEQLADQQENESAWCQMVVNRALSLLLPQEEHQNPCLQVLVSEILSEMIFHNGVCGKACEGWLIWEGITKVIYAIRPDLVPSLPDADQPQGHRLAQFGLLSEKGKTTDPSSQQSEYSRLERLSTTFWTLMQSAWLVWLVLRSWVIALMHASSSPARSGRQREAKMEGFPSHDIVGDEAGWSSPDVHHLSSDSRKVPILGMMVWTCLSTITRLQERMPWLTGMLSLMQWLLLVGPGQLCCTDSRLDRLLSTTLHAHALSPSHLAPALHAARAALFPSNALGAPRSPPDATEAAAIRRECARAIVGVVPPVVRKVYFATSDVEAMCAEVEGELELLFADSWVNKGLVVDVVEVVFGRLFPEILE